MENNLIKLISISSPAVCNKLPEINEALLQMVGTQGIDLIELLKYKNGFYAFESALHVFASGCANTTTDLLEWNRHDLWKKEYEGRIGDVFFFAEDVFGSQFALSHEKVERFDPETGEFEEFAISLEEWAERILSDYSYETGYQIASDWQAIHGPLLKGQRLLPKTPFVLGGAYEIENLYAGNALDGMKFRASIWQQIRSLPDGTPIKLKVV